MLRKIDFEEDGAGVKAAVDCGRLWEGVSMYHGTLGGLAKLLQQPGCLAEIAYAPCILIAGVIVAKSRKP